MDTDVVLDRKLNRLAVPALAAALLALPRVLVSFVYSMGFIFEWFEKAGVEPHRVFGVMNLVHCLTSLVFEVIAILALVLGVAAIVQIRMRPETEKGMGLAVCAVILTLGGTLLVYALWLVGAVRQMAMAG